MVKLESAGVSGGNKNGRPIFGTTPGGVAGLFPLTETGLAPAHSAELNTPSITGGLFVCLATMNCSPGIALLTVPTCARALVSSAKTPSPSRQLMRQTPFGDLIGISWAPKLRCKGRRDCIPN